MRHSKKKEICLPSGMSRIYPITGAPDLYLKNIVITYSNSTDGESPPPRVVPQIDEQSEEEQSDLPPTTTTTYTTTSGDSFVAEIDKNNQPTDFPYPKMGELVANAHIDLIVQNGFDFKGQLVNGIFMHKGSGAIIFELKMKVNEVEDADNYVCGEFEITRFQTSMRSLDPKLLCSALKTCTTIDLHKKGLHKEEARGNQSGKHD